MQAATDADKSAARSLGKEDQHKTADNGSEKPTLRQQAEAGSEDDSKPASQLAAQSQKIAEPAAAAFQAATELLEASVASLNQPTLENIVKVPTTMPVGCPQVNWAL